MTTLLLLRRSVTLGAVAACFAAGLATDLVAGDWPNWRGPTLDGASEEGGLPDKLDASTQLWALDLPGPSAGTPVVVGNRIFLGASDKATSNLVGMCVDRISGKLLWTREIAPSLASNKRNDLAAPSAVTDGKLVVFLYGSGDLATFDAEGKALWARNLQKEFGKFTIMWLYGSSPLLHNGRLFVQVLQNENKKPADAESASFLIALDPVTGKQAWIHRRVTPAKDESAESYGTPIIYTANGREELTLFGADLVTAHDPATGKELWRCDGFNERKAGNWRSIPSATLIDGKVVSITARGSRMFAVKPGGSGDVTASHVAWNTTELTTDVCNPLWYRGKMYVLDGDKKTLACADAATGKPLWKGEIPAKGVLRTSPTGGDGKIYVMDENGTVFVLATDEFKILSTAELGAGGTARSSIPLTHGQVLVRTAEKLIAFGKK